MRSARERALVAAVARRYASAGRSAPYFARGKLTRDPIFAALLEAEVVREGARVLDLGCGQGLWLALVAEAKLGAASLHGIERNEAEVRRAIAALGAEATIDPTDLRHALLPTSDLITAIDVLHYLEPLEQARLLARIAAALAPDGVLLLRICDASAGWRARLTRLADHLGTLGKGGRLGRLHLRSVAEWRDALEALGLETRARNMSAGTPFANVLIEARKLR